VQICRWRGCNFGHGFLACDPDIQRLARGLDDWWCPLQIDGHFLAVAIAYPVWNLDGEQELQVLDQIGPGRFDATEADPEDLRCQHRQATRRRKCQAAIWPGIYRASPWREAFSKQGRCATSSRQKLR
jgi:hypothetical protein